MIWLLISVEAFGQNRIGDSEFSASREGHSAKVVFTVGLFDPSAHKVEGLSPCDDPGLVKIDGRQPLGARICHLPKREIRAMRLTFDKTEIDIPNELFSDCYEPPFPRSDGRISDYFELKIGDDLRSVFIFVNGGDFAGHYQALWVLRPDGKHSRFTTGPCPDCSFIKFDSTFDDRK
jgi:hypothetical protein